MVPVCAQFIPTRRTLDNASVRETTEIGRAVKAGVPGVVAGTLIGGETWAGAACVAGPGARALVPRTEASPAVWTTLLDSAVGHGPGVGL